MQDGTHDLSGRSPSAPDKHDAWFIFLHGLGDTGSGWHHLESAIGHAVPNVKWSFPDAPVQTVTCNGGVKMRSWFDIRSLPIEAGQEIGIDGNVRTSNAALHEPAGLGAAVSAVHAMLTQAESMGYDSTRIVLGGFSQGAALALLAARLYPRQLGGVIGLCGWHLRQHYRPTDLPGHTTPIMLCHGEHDQTVPLMCMQESIDLLLASGHKRVTYHAFFGEHNAADCAEAHGHIIDFLQTHVARVEAAPIGPAAPIPNAPAQHKTVIKMGGRRAAAPLPPEPPATGSSVHGPSPRGPPPPAYSLTEGDDALRIVVTLPGVDGMGALDLCLGADGLELTVSNGSSGPLSLAWPRSVDADGACAKFSRKAAELRVTVPYA